MAEPSVTSPAVRSIIAQAKAAQAARDKQTEVSGGKIILTAGQVEGYKPGIDQLQHPDQPTIRALAKAPRNLATVSEAEPVIARVDIEIPGQVDLSPAPKINPPKIAANSRVPAEYLAAFLLGVG